MRRMELYGRENFSRGPPILSFSAQQGYPEAGFGHHIQGRDDRGGGSRPPVPGIRTGFGASGPCEQGLAEAEGVPEFFRRNGSRDDPASPEESGGRHQASVAPEAGSEKDSHSCHADPAAMPERGFSRGGPVDNADPEQQSAPGEPSADHPVHREFVGETAHGSLSGASLSDQLGAFAAFLSWSDRSVEGNPDDDHADGHAFPAEISPGSP